MPLWELLVCLGDVQVGLLLGVFPFTPFREGVRANITARAPRLITGEGMEILLLRSVSTEAKEDEEEGTLGLVRCNSSSSEESLSSVRGQMLLTTGLNLG